MKNPILLDFPSQIDTPRLMLRPPQAGDGALLYAAIMASLPQLREFSASLPWIAGEQSVETSEIYARTAHANFLARRDFPFLLFTKDSGTFVGCAGLHRPDWNTPKVDIGYWCHTTQARQGFISEAVQELARLGFAELGLARIEIISDEKNAASRKVAEKCGFVMEGMLRNERKGPDGELRNTCVYARIA